jgi:hypothetical protein
VAKHYGAKEAWVEISRDQSEIQLSCICSSAHASLLSSAEQWMETRRRPPVNPLDERALELAR